MNLNEVLDSGKYTIYVDLDGVLVDFDKAAENIGFPNIGKADGKTKSRFWHTIGKLARDGKPFWGAMKPLPDYKALWDVVKKHGAEILSATGHVGNAEQEKREWVPTYLGAGVTVNLVRKSSDKAQYAKPTAILIDDREKSIEPWVAAGGIGILHTSAEDTLKQLEKYGIK